MVDIITKSIFDVFFFINFIFKAVEMDYNDEIPIEKLKQLIESKS